MVPDKVKAVSFRRDVILVSRFSEAPEEGITTKDILCLVENTSVRVVQEFLEIEEETFFDQQAFKADSSLRRNHSQRVSKYSLARATISCDRMSMTNS